LLSCCSGRSVSTVLSACRAGGSEPPASFMPASVASNVIDLLPGSSGVSFASFSAAAFQFLRRHLALPFSFICGKPC
jgi:hypothetical protein